MGSSNQFGFYRNGVQAGVNILLQAAQRSRLLEIAGKCPVPRTLVSEILQTNAPEVKDRSNQFLRGVSVLNGIKDRATIPGKSIEET